MIRRIGYVVVAAGILVPVLAFMLAYVAQDVPRPGELVTNQVSTIYNADGSSVIAKIVPPEGNRQEVDLQQIPEHVRNAVLAAEDRDFYSNSGFSITGFARAARDNILGRDSAGGGSTITQQYVKNALVGDERSLTRKAKELVISIKMANQWPKDEILSAYLNIIYFGRGAYGISAASNAYFDKPVSDLTVAEGAVLASSIQLPSLLDPEQNPEGAEARWNWVLDGMVSAGTLTAEDRATKQYPAYIPIAELDFGDQTMGPNGLIKNQVLAELSAEGIDENLLNTEGLRDHHDDRHDGAGRRGGRRTVEPRGRRREPAYRGGVRRPEQRCGACVLRRRTPTDSTSRRRGCRQARRSRCSGWPPHSIRAWPCRPDTTADR